MSVDTLVTQDGPNSVSNDTAISPATTSENITTSRTAKSTKTVSSDARRPATRSQTGTVAKRRSRDDDLAPEPKKRAQPVRKRHKTTSNFPVTLDPGSSHTDVSASPRPPPTRDASPSSTSSTPHLLSNQKGHLTFYHSSMSETDQPQSRLPRSRASLPTPIPNLTKKSRGRRVPTKETTDADSNQKDTRLYVCSVEGCGKCFHRGEHLKRHIRSIHTHEKPFKCTFPLCEKYFNRHDNLLQHLKVHRQADSLSDQPPERSCQEDSHNELALSAPIPRRRAEDQPSYPQADDEEDTSPASPLARPRTIYDAYPPGYGSHLNTPSSSSSSSVPAMAYGHFDQNTGNEKPNNVIDGVVMHGDMSSSEAMSILTNVAVSRLRMEVSSLRTEPRSSVDMKTMVGTMQLDSY